MNRQARRAQLKEIKHNPPIQIGERIKTPLGVLTSAGRALGRDFYARDWRTTRDEDGHLQPSGELAKEIVDAGLKCIEENSEAILTGKGIKDIPVPKNDVFFLVGAGAGAGYLDRNLIFRMNQVGTIVTTNRGIKLFNDLRASSFLDFAFLVDSRLGIFTSEEWWGGTNKTHTSLIAGYNTFTEATKGWKEVYWFGSSWGVVPEWNNLIKSKGINMFEKGVLDSGLCSLSCQLHWIWKVNPLAKVVLIGHDFCYHQGMKYFDTPFKNNKTEVDRVLSHPDFMFDVMPDKNGVFVITQEYLKIQAQVVFSQVKNMVEGGAEFYNASEGGILYFPQLKQVTMGEFLQ